MSRISLAIIAIITILFITSFDALATEDANSSAAVGEEQGGFGITFFRGWDDEDKTWFMTSELLLVADWGQSVDINRKGITDANPFLNHAPVSTINTYFMCWLIANYFITDNLSGDYRKIWLKGLVLGEVAFVVSNYGAGINIVF